MSNAQGSSRWLWFCLGLWFASGSSWPLPSQSSVSEEKTTFGNSTLFADFLKTLFNIHCTPSDSNWILFTPTTVVGLSSFTTDSRSYSSSTRIFFLCGVISYPTGSDFSSSVSTSSFSSFYYLKENNSNGSSLGAKDSILLDSASSSSKSSNVKFEPLLSLTLFSFSLIVGSELLLSLLRFWNDSSPSVWASLFFSSLHDSLNKHASTLIV